MHKERTGFLAVQSLLPTEFWPAVIIIFLEENVFVLSFYLCHVPT